MDDTSTIDEIPAGLLNQNRWLKDGLTTVLPKTRGPADGISPYVLSLADSFGVNLSVEPDNLEAAIRTAGIR